MSSVAQTIADIAFFIVGVAIIFVALFRPGTFRRGPIEYSNEKLGSVKLDFVAFLVIAGMVMAGVGAYFRWKGYQGQLEALGASQSEMTAKIESLEAQIERFKSYDVNVALSFPETIDSKGIRITPLVKKPGNPNWAIGEVINGVSTSEADNLLSVQMHNLNPGDYLKFRVEQGDRAWKSPQIEVPVFTLAMDEERHR